MLKDESHRLDGVAESKARNVLDKALHSVEFFSKKAKAKLSTALEKEKLHEPVSEPSPRPSVDESSHSQVDEEVLDTIDDVEASLQELRALSKAAKSYAVPPIMYGNTLNAKKPTISSPKLSSISPEERVQREKSESAAPDQWHQQRRQQQELQQHAASDTHSGMRQKLRWGSQEHPSSNSLHGEASSRRSSAELQRHQSGAATSGSALDPQHVLLRTKSGSFSRNSLEQQEGPAATPAAAAPPPPPPPPRRSSVKHRGEGGAAARRNSSMGSTQGGSMSRKSCPLARFEASSTQTLDHRHPSAPADASNSTHPAAKGSWKGVAPAHQHSEQPPPVIGVGAERHPARRRSSVPEYLLQGFPEYLLQGGPSPVDEGQQPFMLHPPEPASTGAHNNGMPFHSHSSPLSFCRGDGRPLPGRFSQLQLRTDLSSPSPSLSPSNPPTAPNALTSSSPSSSGPLAPLSWHASANPTPTGSSTQHQVTHSPSSGPLPSLHSSSSATTASLQAQKALKPSTPTSQSGPLWPLLPNARPSQLMPNTQHNVGLAACPPAAADDEGQHSAVRDASTAQAPPPVKGRFMFATQASINRAQERQLTRSGSSKKRCSQTGHMLSHSTSSCRRRLKRNSSSRCLRDSQGKRRSSSGKRASSNGRRKDSQLSRSSSRRGPLSRTSSRKSLLSSTSRGSLPQSKGSQPSRDDGSDDVSDAGSDTPSLSSAVSSVSQATLGADADCATREPEEAVPGLLGAASYENDDNKGAPLQPSILGHAATPEVTPAHPVGLPPMRPTASLVHISSTSSSTSADPHSHAAAAPSPGTTATKTSFAGGGSAGGAASKSAPRKHAPTKQPSNVRFNLPAVAPPRSPHPPEEPIPPTHTGKASAIPAAIPASKSRSTPTTAASSPGGALSSEGQLSRASVGEGLSTKALAKEALAEVPSTYGKITKQAGSLRQYLAGNRLDVSRLDLDTYLKKLDNENKGRSRSVGRFAGIKRQDSSKSKNPPQRGVCAGEGDSPEENGTSGTAPQGAGSSLASMFAQLGQEEQELQQLHERMRAAAVKAREHGSGVDQCSKWRG